MKLLFLNALKGLKRKKIQMFGIVFMVLLSTAVFTGMNSAIDRLEDRYYNYLDEQDVEHFSIGVNVDFKKDISLDDLDELLETKLKNIDDSEREIVNQYRNLIKNPTFDVNIIYSFKNILEKYDALKDIEMKKLDTLTEKYDFFYEREISKTVQEKNKLFKFIPYNSDKKLNKAYLLEGNLPKNKNEITILPDYAKKNNIKIGDNYKISNTNYKVVGFTYAPDYIYPLISLSMPIFDQKNNCVIYIDKESYNDVVGINEHSYSLKYNFDVDRKFKISATDSENSNDKQMKIFDEKDAVMMDVSTISRIGRIGALQIEFASDRLFADYFMYLLLAISVLIIVVITKKRIDDERLQIGVLKSLGYNKYSIATSYLVYPVLGSLIGGIFGFIIGILVHGPIAGTLRSYYTVPLANYSINFSYLLTSILVPMILLSILSYLIAIFMLRKKPLALLKEGSNLKVNIFSKLVNKITGLLPFNQRFKYSLAFRSIGKLFIVTITAFSTGMLITLILIGMNLFNHVIDKSFEGIDYRYMAASASINEYDKKDSKSDYIVSIGVPVSKITNKDGKNVKFEKDTSFSINGIDVDSKYITLLNKKEKSINKELEDNDGMIISRNASEVYNLNIGDTIKFKHEDLEFEYKVIDINEEFMGSSVYVNRSGLNKRLGVSDKAYSMIYSNNDKYSDMDKLDKEEAETITYLLDVENLKDNIRTQMDRFNGSIYIVILFASVMTLIIIAVIANIVVEENKKTISLMKVMGYDNKKISSIVLNIYTPFIIVAYILSIPLMVKILKLIVKAITGDIEVTIPIEVDPFVSAMGLVGLLVAYYVALALSKKVLNRIPLAIALKRE